MIDFWSKFKFIKINYLYVCATKLCKTCKRQFIGDHSLSYKGCNSGITRKILKLMVRGSGIREIERISIGKVLRILSESTYQIQPDWNRLSS